MNIFLFSIIKNNNMMYQKYVSIILFLLFTESSIGQNTVCFTIEDNPDINSIAYSDFTKYVRVLDCFNIYAESSIPDAKVLHAASIAAELLDNNEDGEVDDPLLKDELNAKGALIPIFAYDGSPAMDNFFDNYNGNGAAAVLWRNEIDPNNPGYWGADATVEEIVHVINVVGHTNIYPNAFSLQPNSSLLTEAMDMARGGQFIQHPGSYPEEAWYHYDDYTCDYECMAVEYLYWCIVTDMGILSDNQTCAGIANEWEPCTPELFEEMDTLMFSLVNNNSYLLPQLAPDGNYCPSNVQIENRESFPNAFQLFPAYPNPFNPETKIDYRIPKGTIFRIEIIDIQGKLVKTLIHDKISQGDGQVKWDGRETGGSMLPSGIYFYRLSSSDFIQTKKIVLLR